MPMTARFQSSSDCFQSLTTTPACAGDQMVCAATPVKAVEVLRSTSTEMAGTATIRSLAQRL
jgi:hypothetical protein